MADYDYRLWQYGGHHSNNDYDEDGYEIFSYLSSDDKTEENYDELQPGVPHRWNLQSYFQDLPSWDSSEKNTSYSYYIFPDSVEFKIDWSYVQDGENDNLSWASYDPQESDGSDWSYSVTIGPSVPGISAGLTYAYTGDTLDVDEDHNDTLIWDQPLSSFPKDRDDTRGVYTRAEAGSNYREEVVRFATTYSWDYYRRPRGSNYGTSVYSESGEVAHFANPEVVKY